MQKAIRSVSPLRYGVVLAVLSAIIGLIYGIIGLIVVSSMPPEALNDPALGGDMSMMVAGGGFMMIVFGLIGGAIGGFIAGVIGAFIYNIVAGITGGIVITLEDA
jgi:hypothetical protein